MRGDASLAIGSGHRLLHYRIVETLGRGGMGEVYLAEDTRLKRRVALKVLPAGMAADPERRQRFEREAQAVAALNHPNIVTIHSVEQAEDPSAGAGGSVHFITMELIDGEPLSRIIGSAGCSLERLLEVAVPLADALAAAHERGITHRDLKPDNVMLTRDGRVKVLDFGLAKLAQAPADEQPDAQRPTATVTHEGRILGTVTYMSPEQAEGKPVDARSDVFSLGVLLYEMATGRRPFRGETTISTITSILRDTPVAVTELNRTMPRHLGRVVNRCLMKDPERRYQTAKEVRNELEQLRAEVASAAAAPEAPVAAARRSLGGRLVALAIVGFMALVLAAILWLKFGASRPAPGGAVGPVEASIAVLPFTSVGEDPESLAFSSGLHNDLLIRLSKIGALKVISRTSVMEYRDATRNLRQIAEELGVATVLEGSVQRAGNRVRFNAQLVRAQNDESMWAETYDRELTAGSIFDIQEDVAEQIAAALQARLTAEERRELESRPTANLEAYEAYLRALDYTTRSEEESDQRIALQMMERAVALDPDFAVAHAQLGVLHAQMFWHHWDRSPERLERAREAIETALRLAPGLPEGRMARGYYHYWGFLEYERALEEFAAAATAQPNNTAILSGIGFVKRRQGRMEEALAMFKRSAELNPRDLVGVEAVAATTMLLRDYDEADRLYTRLLQLNPANGNAYLARANLQLQSRGDVDRARAIIAETDALGLPGSELEQAAIEIAIIAGDFADALRRLDAVGGEVAVDNQFVYWPKELVRARVHRLAGAAAAARASYEAARTDLERAARERPRDERIPSALGMAYAGLGRKQDAIREGLRGVELLPYEKEAWRGARRVRDLAAIYAQVGEPELAIDRLEFLLARPGELSAAYLGVDPTWTPLRAHPRFRRLVGGP